MNNVGLLNRVRTGVYGVYTPSPGVVHDIGPVYISPEPLIPGERRIKILKGVLNKELLRLKIPAHSYSMSESERSSISKSLTVILKNPSGKGTVKFTVHFGYRRTERLYDGSGNRYTSVSASFRDPLNKYENWNGNVAVKKLMDPNELGPIFRNFLVDAQIKFHKWQTASSNEPSISSAQPTSVAQATKLSLSVLEREEVLKAFCKEVQDFYAGLRQQPVIGSRLSDGEIDILINELSEISGCRDINRILEKLRPLMLEQYREWHPRFFDYVGSSPSDAISVIASGLAALYNPFGGTVEEARGAVQAEKAIIRKIAREMFHFEENTVDGLFLNGGTLALETILQAAFVKGFSNKLMSGEIKKDDHDAQVAVWQDLKRRARFYTSGQFNGAIGKALRSFGFYINLNDPINSQLRIVETNKDVDFILPHKDLEKVVSNDLQSELWPCCVIFNLGSTSTGAIDDVSQSADFCREQGIYMAGDATYGGGIALCQHGDRLLLQKGINLLDALTYGPQKLGGQPFGNVAAIAKRRSDLEMAHQLPRGSVVDYETGVGNPCDIGLNFTRSMEGLFQVLFSETFYGPDEQARSVETLLKLTEYAKETVLKYSSLLELTSEPGITVITFRFKPSEPIEEDKLNQINALISKLIYKTEYAAVGTADLNLNTGSPKSKVLRMCLVNPATTKEDIRTTIGLALVIGQSLWDKEKGELKDSNHYKQMLARDFGLSPDQFKILEVINSNLR